MATCCRGLAGHGAVPEAFGEHIPSGSSPIPVAAPAHRHSEDIVAHSPFHLHVSFRPWAAADRRPGRSNIAERCFFELVLVQRGTLPEEGKSTGNEQSEDLTHYSELNEVRMNRLDKIPLKRYRLRVK